jgi:hypothetical protein
MSDQETGSSHADAEQPGELVAGLYPVSNHVEIAPIPADAEADTNDAGETA